MAFFSFFSSTFDILYPGAFQLFIIGQMGCPGLCNFIWALKSGGCGFF